MEEAPLAKPITPKDSRVETIKATESIDKNYRQEFNYENKKYIFSLSLSENNKLIFKMKESNIASSYYISTNTLEELKKLNKQFRLYDTGSEVFEALNDILSTNQAFIQKENDKFSIKFYFPLPGNKNQEIIIPLKTTNFEQKNLNDEIIQKINDLENKLNKEIQENQEYKKNIEENMKSMEQYKNIINDLQKEIVQLKDEIKELKKLNIEKRIDFLKSFESNIIKEKKEYDLIENRLKITGNNKKIKYKLLYRASVDGDSATTFHEKCNGISGTLSLIKTKNNAKFGGYTKALWDGNGYKKDGSAFCFSLNLNKIYNVIKEDEAIQTNENLGPRFGGTLFGIYDDFFRKEKRGGWCSYNESHHEYGNISNKEITGGEKFYGILEIEVYEIIFE